MLRGAEVVYLERNRERSLAFRLFRDGVRRLTISPDVAWEESFVCWRLCPFDSLGFDNRKMMS